MVVSVAPILTAAVGSESPINGLTLTVTLPAATKRLYAVPLVRGNGTSGIVEGVTVDEVPMTHVSEHMGASYVVVADWFVMDDPPTGTPVDITGYLFANRGWVLAVFALDYTGTLVATSVFDEGGTHTSMTGVPPQMMLETEPGDLVVALFGLQLSTAVAPLSDLTVHENEVGFGSSSGDNARGLLVSTRATSDQTPVGFMYQGTIPRAWTATAIVLSDAPTLPDAPTAPTAAIDILDGDTTLTVSFAIEATGVEHEYRVTVNDGTPSVAKSVGAVGTDEFAITGLSGSTRVLVEVRANDGTNASAWVAAKAVTMAPPRPTGMPVVLNGQNVEMSPAGGAVGIETTNVWMWHEDAAKAQIVGVLVPGKYALPFVVVKPQPGEYICWSTCVDTNGESGNSPFVTIEVPEPEFPPPVEPIIPVKPRGETLFFVVLRGYDPETESEREVYLSSGRFNSGPLDTPPHQHFIPRLVRPVTIERSLYAPGTTQGRSEIALGRMVLANVDGALDYLLDWGFDGRTLDLYRGETGLVFPDEMQSVFTGTVDAVIPGRSVLELQVRDLQYDATLPVQETLYAGDNANGEGVEGTADDIMGKPKPLTWGRCRNVPGVLVNASRLIYQWHDGAVQAFTEVYDKGVSLTHGTAHTSQAALEAGSVAAGTFNTYLGGGLVRLGSTPVGTVTADVVEGATAADRTAGQIARRVLLHAGWDDADIDYDTIVALDTASGAEVGIHVGTDERSVAEVLDELLGGIGAWWGQTPEGLFQSAVFSEPTDDPVASFVGEAFVLSLDPVVSSEPGTEIPTWRVVAKYQRNHHVQDEDQVAGSVSLARRAWLAQEYRTVAYADETVREKHQRSPALEIVTPFDTEAAALAEATRVQALRGVQRRRYRARVKLNDDDPESIGPGDVVYIEYPRYGLDAGKLFRVTGLEPDNGLGILQLHIWG